MCRNRNFESPFPPARGRPLACPSRPHARHVGAGPRGAEPNRSTEPNRSALQQRRGGCRDRYRSEFKNRTELQENRTVRDPIGRRGIPATSRVASRVSRSKDRGGGRDQDTKTQLSRTSFLSRHNPTWTDPTADHRSPRREGSTFTCVRAYYRSNSNSSRDFLQLFFPRTNNGRRMEN